MSPKLKFLRVKLVSACVILAFMSCYQPTQFELPEFVAEDPFITGSEVEDFLGTSNAKVAFTLQNNGPRRIFWTSFTEASPALHAIRVPEGKEHMNADSPLLSPDGKWVAYFMEGNKEWEAYFQKLDATSEPILLSNPGSDPHWWTDPEDSSLYIVYANTGDFVEMGTLKNETGATYKQQVDLSGDGQLTGEPELLVNKPFVGGLSIDGNYLVTGYSDAAFYNLQDSQLVIINSNRQVCNASASPDPDHPDWMLFLHFQGVQNVQGDSLGDVDQHEYIYFVDANNTLRDYIQAPPEAKEWQDPEWSNHPQYVISLGGGQDNPQEGNPQDIYIINRVDKSILKINNTENITFNFDSTPSLWLGGVTW